MTRVLFLDVDGVLNSERTRIAFGGYPGDFSAVDMGKFDHAAINMVRALCRKADLSVVVSSAWRIAFGWDEIGKALDLPTIGQTPRLPGARGHEIAAWLAEHPEVESYAILDDSGDMLPEQMERFAQTSMYDGLRWDDMQRLCAMFGLTAYDCFNKEPALGWERN